MARPPLILETWGKIRRTTVNGVPTAVAYYRDSDGVTRKMQRQAETAAKAERELVRAMKARLSPAADDLTRESRLSLVASKWMQETQQRDLAAGTIRQYQGSIERHILPGLGEVRLAEATVPRVDRFLKSLTISSGPGAARTARVVLSGMFGLAARHGAIEANPIREVASVPRAKRNVAAPDRAAINGIRQRFAWWDAQPDKRGGKRTTDLLDPCDMVIGTGMRTGELLALTWADVDFTRGTVTIRSTLAANLAGKMGVQPKPKSRSSVRELYLPAHVLQMLARRPHVSEFVFPSSVQTFRHPNNFRTSWRKALAGTEFAGVTPKSFRKAVATVLRDELGVGAAKDQLGHASEVTTNAHYVMLAHEGPSGQAVLESLFTERGER
jgi:integrase